MKKYFFIVYFNYNDDSGMNQFDLGIFSSKKKALKKIELVKDKEGFNTYSNDNFLIKKIGVDFSKPIINKSEIVLYSIYHEYMKIEENKEVYYWNFYGLYSDKNKAAEEVMELKLHTRIGKKYPDCFEIVDEKVDNMNSWAEGFNHY